MKSMVSATLWMQRTGKGKKINDNYSDLDGQCYLFRMIMKTPACPSTSYVGQTLTSFCGKIDPPYYELVQKMSCHHLG